LPPEPVSPPFPVSPPVAELPPLPVSLVPELWAQPQRVAAKRRR
jgi:hypothetical protein